MITGKEYLKANIGNTNIPEEHYENEIGEMMEWYADDYHKEQVKNLTIANVRISFVDWIEENYPTLKNHGDSLTLSQLKDAYKKYTNEA